MADKITWPFDLFFIFLILLFLGFLSMTWAQKRKIQPILWGICVFMLGFFVMSASHPVKNESHIAFYNGKEINLTGAIKKPIDEREKTIKITLGDIEIDERDIKGNLLITIPNFPGFSYNDRLKVICKLRQPEKFEQFDYEKYLEMKDVYSLCYYPSQIEPVGQGKINVKTRLQAWFIDAQAKIHEKIREVFFYPESEVLSAMLIGKKRDLAQNIQDNFSRAGISHIVAISGLHMTIVSSILMSILLGIGFKRKHAFILATIGIISFIALIGFKISSIRAGVMGILMLLGMTIGRLYQIRHALFITGFIMLIFNPKLALYDIGFQLSFMAVIGIAYFYEPIERYLKKIHIPETWLKIRSIVALTLSAQVTVLPIVAYNFQMISIFAPIANLFIVPFLPIVMIGGIVVIIAGFIYFPIALVLSWPVQILVLFMIWLAKTITLIPFSYLEWASPSILLVVGYYGVLVLGYRKLKHRNT